MRSLIGAVIDRAPVPYVARSGMGLSIASAMAGDSRADQVDAMGTNGTLFSIVNRNSTAVASVEWKLWRIAKSGKSEDRVEVTSHLALDVWARPNPFYTGVLFREAVQQHVELTGEGWLIVGRDARADFPMELWFVRPDRIAPVPSPRDFIAGYVYTGPGGEKVPLKVNEVMRIMMPNPADPYRGMGAVQAILTDLDSAKYSAEWNRNFFVNSAEPGGIIEFDRRLSDTEFDEMSERWDELHRGVSKAHTVAFIEAGKWVNRTFTMRDMQFAELRNVSRDIIREAFGMPKFAVGDVDDVNRATADASAAWFGDQLTVPRLERWKSLLNHEYLPMFGPTGKGVEFDYVSPVPEDKDAVDRERVSVSDTVVKLSGVGFTQESLAEAYGLPATLVWKEPPPPALPAAPGEPDTKAAAPPGGSARSNRRRVFSTRPGRVPRNTFDLAPVQEDWEAALAALGTGWANEITPEQVASLERQVAAAIEGDALASLTTMTVITAGATALLALVMSELAIAASDRVVEEADAQGVTIAPVALSVAVMTPYAEVTTGLLGAGLATSAGREALRLYVPGAAGADVAAAVRQHLESLSDAYLNDHLGGALTRAQNLGRLATLRAAPKARYFASEVLDRSTCDACEKIDGVELPTLDAATVAYGGGPYLLCRGGVRCRGTMRAVWTEYTGDPNEG